MTKFNPENKAELTYGESLGSIFNITDRADAMQYKESYIEYLKNASNISYPEAEKIANSNIGYYAGYGSKEDRDRINDLFDAKHPVFGSNY